MSTTLTVERLGHQGDGIAAGPIFIPRVLPGEEVEGMLEGNTLTDPRILTPSENRVRPPCPHTNACGGCALQHASDPFVATWKQEIVINALSAQGLVAEMRPIQTSPARSRRRAVLAGRRTKKGAIVGFHGRKSGTLTPVPGCEILSDRIRAGLPYLEQLTIAGGSRKGEVTFSVTDTEAGLDVMVSGGKPLDNSLRMALVAHLAWDGLARLTWEDEPLAVQHAPAIQMGSARVVPPPGAFLQATPQGQDALVAAVADAVGTATPVVDLFAGCGTFALPLAARAPVHAVEGASEMLESLAAGWRGAERMQPVTTETRDLFRRPLLPDELAKFGAAVIDPPRAGAVAQIAELAKSDIARIASVSCNPVTFARDMAVLTEAGFTLDWVQVVDQFRWSPHIEVVALLTR